METHELTNLLFEIKTDVGIIKSHLEKLNGRVGKLEDKTHLLDKSQDVTVQRIAQITGDMEEHKKKKEEREDRERKEQRDWYKFIISKILWFIVVLSASAIGILKTTDIMKL